MNKKARTVEKKFIVIICTIVAIPLVCLIGVLIFRYNLNQYKHHILSLDPSWVCSTTSSEGQNIILSDDNQRKLINLLTRYHEKLLFHEPIVTNSMKFTFTKRDSTWTLTISETENEYLKIDLVGNKEFHIYIQEKEYYERIQKIASADNLESPNKVLGGKK